MSLSRHLIPLPYKISYYPVYTIEEHFSLVFLYDVNQLEIKRA